MTWVKPEECEYHNKPFKEVKPWKPIKPIKSVSTLLKNKQI